MGEFPEELSPKISGDKIAFEAQQLHTKFRFLCFVYSKKRVQDLGRRKRKKMEQKEKKREKRKRKRKKTHRAKSGVVEIKEYLKTYNRVKYFLPYLSRFLMRPLFTLNFPGGLWILKPKSRD